MIGWNLVPSNQICKGRASKGGSFHGCIKAGVSYPVIKAWKYLKIWPKKPKSMETPKIKNPLRLWICWGYTHESLINFCIQICSIVLHITMVPYETTHWCKCTEKTVHGIPPDHTLILDHTLLDYTLSPRRAITITINWPLFQTHKRITYRWGRN